MRVVLTGGRGMLGSTVKRFWNDRKPNDDLVVLTRKDVDLRDAVATRELLGTIKPDLLIHTAAKVGGIAANIADPTMYLMDNLLIDTSVLRSATELGIGRLLYVGSSCMYPRDYRQPLIESDLLAGPLEPTNEGYALAKIVASKYCEYASMQLGLIYRVIVPSNLYGPGDDYAAGTSHLVAAALAKTHNARARGDDVVEVWGDGTARREFTYVEDLAGWLVDAVELMAEWPPLLNVGCGIDYSVLEIYEFAARVTGWRGRFELQPDKPSGMHQKLMDSSLARRWGWGPSTSLEEGMRAAYEKFGPRLI